ncbi:MAG: tRNA-binding protein [Cyclobacteriaceae bacterium]|nr:tRNA-binding protein [Cyclobacteriaceae bacterium]
MELSWTDFEKVEMRVGTVLTVEEFPEARKPAYKLTIDFGQNIGIRKSSAQVTALYRPEDILGRQVIAVVNFPRKQIGPFISECLVMGAYSDNNEVVLLAPERHTPEGSRIG